MDISELLLCAPDYAPGHIPLTYRSSCTSLVGTQTRAALVLLRRTAITTCVTQASGMPDITNPTRTSSATRLVVSTLWQPCSRARRPCIRSLVATAYGPRYFVLLVSTPSFGGCCADQAAVLLRLIELYCAAWGGPVPG